MSLGWCVTFNAPDPIGCDDTKGVTWCMDNEPKWKPRVMQYLCYALQRGDEARRWHWQIYVQFKCTQPLGQAKKHMGEKSAHMEKQRGTAAEARDYILVDEKKTNMEDPVEHGEWKEDCQAGAGAGARSDLVAYRQKIVSEGLSKSLLLAEAPDTYCRYAKAFDHWFVEAERKQPVLAKKFEPERCKDACKAITDYLAIAENDRKILWLWEPVGGVGKSAILTETHNQLLKKGTSVFMCKGGKDADCAHAYDGQQVVLMDVGRSGGGGMAGASIIPYVFMEQVLDRVVTSGKYMSCTKKLKEWPYIIVAANVGPDHNALSGDRFIELKL